jgi:hypothetical protein
MEKSPSPNKNHIPIIRITTEGVPTYFAVCTAPAWTAIMSLSPETCKGSESLQFWYSIHCSQTH